MKPADDALTCQEMVDRLEDYVDRNLEPDELRRVEAHLADCLACHGFAASAAESPWQCLRCHEEPQGAHLFPADRAMWLPESRRIHVVLSGKDGRYSLKGLPPGDYRVVSLLGPEPGREFDSVWLSELFALSHAVKLTGGQAVTHNISVK